MSLPDPGESWMEGHRRGYVCDNVYACDVMSPTNTENVHCRLITRLVCGLLEVTHQNTRMQLVQIRGSCDGLLG